MKIYKKKILRTSILTIVSTLILFFFASLIFPKTWPMFDNVRLYFQKHVITWLSNIHYRSQIGNTILLSDLFSQKKLFPGDLIFTSTTSSLASAFIDGKRKHVALYLGTPQELKILMGQNSRFYQTIESLPFDKNTPLMIESSFDGVHIFPLQDFEAREAIAAMRLELPKKKLRIGLELLTDQLGKPYDFDFNSDEDEFLYCSELLLPIIQAWGFNPERDSGVFRSVISPDAILRSFFDKKIKKSSVHLLFYVEGGNNALHFIDKKELEKTITY